MSKKGLSSKSKTPLSAINTQKLEVLPNLKSLNLSKQNHEAISEIIEHTMQFKRAIKEPMISSKHTGLSILLTGENSSSKLSAAAFIANELNKNLYRVDLSYVVNKYIGETEKNLDKIFDTAMENDAILFFDEADALFGKRSEVKDSHDRYANLEVSYLLQRLESFEGLAILTSNIKSSHDLEFPKRIRYAINFPFPDTKQREQIWGKICSMVLALFKKRRYITVVEIDGSEL